MKTKRIIYDIGANNGDNIPYYLLRADLVVAVEANPELCEQINARFPKEIRSGRLKVDNCVVTDDRNVREIDFYLHRTLDVLSQCDPPPADRAHEFRHLLLKAKFIVDIVKENGEPYYVKLDVEHYDARLLNALFASNVVPPYVSAECHEFDVLAALYEQGGYRAFKLADGMSIPSVYNRRTLRSGDGCETIEHSFPPQSAGPFGEDLDGPWLSAEDVTRLLGFAGFGWKDIHATTLTEPNATQCADVRDYLDRLISWPALVGYTTKRTLRSLRGRMLRSFRTLTD